LSSHEFRHINIDIFDEIWSECEMPHWTWFPVERWRTFVLRIKGARFYWWQLQTNQTAPLLPTISPNLNLFFTSFCHLFTRNDM
jgi:hypothetical protein